MAKLIKLENVSLSSHPAAKESWIQDQIAKEPTILGLDDLV